jgi:hypothetical protein
VAVERTVSEAGAPRVQLHVSDDGTGMTAEVAARAFEPFFTTKARGQGTGLGLASVHGMAVQSAGSALITSTPGRGTRVTIDLPYVDEPATAPPLAVSAQAAWSPVHNPACRRRRRHTQYCRTDAAQGRASWSWQKTAPGRFALSNQISSDRSAVERCHDARSHRRCLRNAFAPCSPRCRYC